MRHKEGEIMGKNIYFTNQEIALLKSIISNTVIRAETTFGFESEDSLKRIKLDNEILDKLDFKINS